MFLSDKIILNHEVKKIQTKKLILVFELKSENEGQYKYGFQFSVDLSIKIETQTRLSLMSTFVSVDLKK